MPRLKENSLDGRRLSLRDHISFKSILTDKNQFGNIHSTCITLFFGSMVFVLVLNAKFPLCDKSRESKIGLHIP